MTEEQIDHVVYLLNQSFNQDQAALAELDSILESDFQVYVYILCAILERDSIDEKARQLAGFQLKNALTSKDDAVFEKLAERWCSAISDEARSVVHVACLNGLVSASRAIRRLSAQIISSVATIEIPSNLWPDLFDTLMSGVVGDVSVEQKESCFLALSYICDGINPDYLVEKSSSILEAISVGLRKEEETPQVRLAALGALVGALDFSEKHFENDEDRNYIMNMICEATQDRSLEDIRDKAMDGLIVVAERFYPYLPQYMDALRDISFAEIQAATGVEGNEEPVAIKSVALWSAICDAEIKRQELIMGHGEDQTDLKRAIFWIVKAYLGPLLELIWATLQKQESEEQSQDTWNVSVAAALCLQKIAENVKDDVVSVIMPSIIAGVESEDWRVKEASVVAFGSVLDGPTATTLQELVKSAVPLMVEFLKHDVPIIRDSSAWTVGRICELHPDIVTGSYMQLVVTGLVEATSQDPRVANLACWGLHNLARAFGGVIAETNALSPYFENIVQALLFATQREDSSEENLRVAAYESLAVVCSAAPEDVFSILQMYVLPEVNARLNHLLTLEQSDEVMTTEGQLVGMISECVTRLDQSLDEDAINTVFVSLMSMLEKNGISAAAEEVFLCFSSLLGVLGNDFMAYMDRILPFIIEGIHQYQAASVCAAVVGLIFDLVDAVEGKISPYAHDILVELVTLSHHEDLDPEVRGSVLGSFGDFALVMEGEFRPFLMDILNVMHVHVEAECVKKTHEELDEDDVEDEQGMWMGLMETYSGILQGLKDFTGVVEEIWEYIQDINNVIRIVVQYKDNVSDEVAVKAVGLLNDLGDVFEGRAASFAMEGYGHLIPLVEDLTDEDVEGAEFILKESRKKIDKIRRN
eukprot:TRINITY_DN81056_c0_g1_i1.p1 TRINITY_DN81056_c0_g1~~TRINITY_DN81056_c0_g1_i1.p1  ORF type:complete len:873 (-),score=259.29 TRINITY_DN81056_c0_g1_i1:401-3019(-)